MERVDEIIMIDKILTALAGLREKHADEPAMAEGFDNE